MANGFTVLVTWPEIMNSEHRQETWYAHIFGEAEAVKAVQEACGALNDAKVELFGPLLHSSLANLGIPEGEARKQNDL
jgi:hypothetical protein